MIDKPKKFAEDVFNAASNSGLDADSILATLTSLISSLICSTEKSKLGRRALGEVAADMILNDIEGRCK
jgi:hypothetical protein